MAVGKAPPLAEIGPAIGLPDKEQAGEPHQRDGEHKPDARSLLLHPEPQGQQGQHKIGGAQGHHQAKHEASQRYLSMLQGQQRPEPCGERRPVRETGERQCRGERQGQHQQPDWRQQAWSLPHSDCQASCERRQQAGAEQACPLHSAGWVVHQQIDKTRQPDKGGVAGKVGG